MHLPHLKSHPHIPFFRIFYSTTFTLLTLLLTAALLITPGDHIHQSFHAGRIYHIFVIAGFYLLTFIIAVLIYGARLYATRSALAGIPREWSITEGGKGVGIKFGRVRKVIQSGLERSAWVAYETRPRDLTEEKRNRRSFNGRKRAGRRVERQSEDSQSPMQPAWGTISHPGWSSPSSPDLPNLHYEPVILELPHLIEAKAVSLAPPDPLYQGQFPPENEPASGQEPDPPPPDPLIVSLLQRPSSASLRAYLAHLTSLNMLQSPTLGASFLAIYEQARFSGEELNEIEFRGLMSLFADILRNMTPLAPEFVEDLRAEAGYDASNDGDERDEGGDEIDGASLKTSGTVQRTPQPDLYTSDSASITSDDNGSQGTIHTARSRPRTSRMDSNRSKATRVSQRRGLHTPSIPSLRPLRSERSNATLSIRSIRSAAGSVIRLAEARTELDLPYEFVSGDEER